MANFSRSKSKNNGVVNLQGSMEACRLLVLRLALSVWRRTQGPRTSPGHAGHRCGMTVVMRRWMTRGHIEPDWDMAAQPAPDFDVDRQVNW